MRDAPNGMKAWVVYYDIYLFISLFMADAGDDLFGCFFYFLLAPRTSWPAMMSMVTTMTRCHVMTPAMKTSEWHAMLYSTEISVHFKDSNTVSKRHWIFNLVLVTIFFLHFLDTDVGFFRFVVKLLCC